MKMFIIFREARRKAKLARKGLTEREEEEVGGEDQVEDNGGEYSSGSEQDMSWLPDPDKIYGPPANDDAQDEDDDKDNSLKVRKRNAQDSDSEDEYFRSQVVNTSDESSDEEELQRAPVKKPGKKKRKTDESYSGNDLDEKSIEELALKLISKR